MASTLIDHTLPQYAWPYQGPHNFKQVAEFLTMGPTLEPTSYVRCKVDKMKQNQKMDSTIYDFSWHVNAKMHTSIQS